MRNKKYLNPPGSKKPESVHVNVNQQQADGQSNQQDVNVHVHVHIDESDIDDDEVEARKRRRKEDLTQLIGKWPEALATCNQRRLLLLVDTLEKLDSWDITEREGFWAALGQARRKVKTLRVVAASRHVIINDALEAYSLDSLAPQESGALLQQLGVSDAAFRVAVYERLARGHPYVTRFAATAWREAQKAQRQLETATHRRLARGDQLDSSAHHRTLGTAVTPQAAALAARAARPHARSLGGDAPAGDR